jgi:hypothetical protein
MAINRISGNILQDNLVRGNDLSFTSSGNATPILHIDVANNRVGINDATPQCALDINGNLQVDNISTHTGNITLNIDSDVQVLGNLTADNFIGNIPASTNILYVAKNGSDSNPGNINAPFLTIKAALAVATSGTSVHVAPGSYTEDNPITIPSNVSLIGNDLRTVFVTPATPNQNLFYVRNGCYVWGITIRDYLANGFSFDPATPTQNVFVSPYIQNITSSTTTGTAVEIDGDLTSAISTKAMILGFFTIINRGGRGVIMLNNAYSQAVNIYTIACDIGVKVDSGSFITLNGSDNGIGNFGLWANGVGTLQTAGTTVGTSTRGIFIVNHTGNARPNVNTVMEITGDPTFYTIDDIVPIDAVTTTITVQQVYGNTLSGGTAVQFFNRSSIIASAHTFEYVGAGTNPATALPQYGGIPIEANEVLQTNGGVVTFTSTDHKGNFKVGEGFIVNQATGTVEGEYYFRSLFGQMTPFILALSESS